MMQALAPISVVKLPFWRFLSVKRNLLITLSLLALLACSRSAHAHIGSKDVFETVHAGPYTLYVTVRPPLVIPGIATVEIQSTGAVVDGLRIMPLPVTGEASKHPPAADVMQQDGTDKTFFTGAVWMMAPGTWQVRIEAQGAAGPQTATVPVLAVPVATLPMQRGLKVLLSALAIFLLLSLSAVVRACVLEARLPPGLEPSRESRRRGLLAFAGSLAVMVFIVYAGGQWWNVEAADYAKNVFQSAPTSTKLQGNQLDLLVQAMTFEDVRRSRLNDDYLPDHGHLMHLYAIRWPAMDTAFHLHPVLASAGDFRDQLPSMPAGHYRLFGDVVHSSGFPETLLATIDIPTSMPGVPLDPEDAEALPPAIFGAPLGNTYHLPDGYSMVWDRPATLSATKPLLFHFRLLDAGGKPAVGMQPYLGMPGHAAFVKSDGSVFAHTHPEGSAAMADVMLANDSLEPGRSDMAHSAAKAMPEEVSPEIDFPYGFPASGRYRIFVQMKHAGVVETGVFDAAVK